jgi:hypothetical protein
MAGIVSKYPITLIPPTLQIGVRVLLFSGSDCRVVTAMARLPRVVCL